MATQDRRSKNHRARTVRVAGRDWPVLNRMVLGRRTYLVLNEIGYADRRRYMAFDPHAGPDGDLRALILAPSTPAARQHLRVLKRLSTGNGNLPLILDYQMQGGQLVIVTTWVHGPDLQSYLDSVRDGEKPRPSVTEAFRLFRGLAHGLSQLHRRRGIVHGDIKPANLILANQPVRLVMIDYGSAWLAARTKHRLEGDGVSLAYAAPELQTGQPFVDFRSDQFSASVLLYELLTLQRPFEGLGGQAGRPEFKGHMQGKLVAASRFHPDRGRLPKPVWQAIDDFLIRGLDFNPNARCATPGEWLDVVDALSHQIKPRSHLTPLNSRMTRVVNWFAQLWRER